MKKWQDPLRIIQTNLQVTDATDLDAERLAEQIHELGANTLVFNVGGIYAWYPSQIPYHTINPLMDKNRDIVGEVVEACRKRDILFIARYDFSKAADYVYRDHPEWFVRLNGNYPQVVAQGRFGKWDQLVSTCLHGGYQNEEVAYKVLQESIERFRPDGVFITSMIYAPCQCENCRRIYRERYGKDIPVDPVQYEPGFAEEMMDESVKRYDAFVKSIDPDIAFLHRVMVGDGRTDQADTFKKTKWWFPRTGEYDVFFEHPIDLIHGETHDGLTGGKNNLSPRFTPGLAMKIAASLPHIAPPIDIVHSAPGVGWRHTGLPAAEHRFWLSQVPANGGQIWHSLTSIPDHIPDKQQLASVRWLNERIQKVSPWMHNAHSAASIALIWDDVSGHGWCEGLTAARIPFDVLLQRQIANDGIDGKYRWVICPQKNKYMQSTVTAIEQFIGKGGSVLFEGRLEDSRLKKMVGLSGSQQESEWLSTSYLRLEDGEKTSLLPFSGFVQYSHYDPACKVLATLIPPFAPAEGAGSPPERAVLPEINVRWPMVVKKGKVVHCAFQFCELLEKYGLRSHLEMLDEILSGDRIVRINKVPGIQLTVFKVYNGYMIHLVNGVGERPLQETVQVHEVMLDITLPEKEQFVGAELLFRNQKLNVEWDGKRGKASVVSVGSWEVVLIQTKEVV